MRQSGNYGALHETHHHVEEHHIRLEPQSRQPRNYEVIREAQYQVDEQQRGGPEAAPLPEQPRNYQLLRDAQRQAADQAAKEPSPDRPDIHRSWTHRGGMVPQQESAIRWDRQNQEIIRMSDNQKSGDGREGQGAQQGVNENDPELQEARAAVEEARRREAAERARQQERDRGPER